MVLLWTELRKLEGRQYCYYFRYVVYYQLILYGFSGGRCFRQRWQGENLPFRILCAAVRGAVSLWREAAGEKNGSRRLDMLTWPPGSLPAELDGRRSVSNGRADY